MRLAICDTSPTHLGVVIRRIAEGLHDGVQFKEHLGTLKKTAIFNHATSMNILNNMTNYKKFVNELWYASSGMSVLYGSKPNTEHDWWSDEQ